MDQLVSIRSLARQLARQNAPHDRAQTRIDLARAVSQQNLYEIPPHLWDELEVHLNHNPSLGLALAHVLHAIACRRQLRVRATADLALIRAFNVCGEFGEALKLCPPAARRFAKRGEMKQAAWVWLEAAWAATYLGDMRAAEEHLECAAQVYPPLRQDPQLGARFDWIRARLLREGGSFDDALHLFAEVRERFLAADKPIEALRILCEIGRTRERIDPRQALPILEDAHKRFQKAGCLFDAALCRYFLAQTYMDLNQFDAAYRKLASARKVFRLHGLDFFDAYCDLGIGVLYAEQDRFRDALALHTRARSAFVRLGAEQEVSSCDINIGWALLRLNHYADALPHFDTAARVALETGRLTKAANCFLNMGWAYMGQERYTSALEHFLRARELFARQQALPRLIECDLILGLLYFQLGDLREAMTILKRTRKVCIAQEMPARLAECELYFAQVYIATGRRSAAQTSLETARALFQQTKQTSWAAVCGRQLAVLAISRRQFRDAAEYLRVSRRVFVGVGQPVERAQCDLTSADLALAQKKFSRAAHLFRQARRDFGKELPDLTWRAEFGLGQIAHAHRRNRQALAHYRQAIELVASIRSTLVTESWSNLFFGARLRVYEAAVALAYTCHQEQTLLEIMEAAKARLFSVSLARREWRSPHNKLRRVQAAQTRASELRVRLEELHTKLGTQTLHSQVSARRGDASNLSQTLAEIDITRARYEETVLQLRVVKRGLEGVPTLPPFDLASFRAQAQAQWGKHWAALVYYFGRAGLYVLSVEADHIRAQHIRLSAIEMALLNDYSNPNKDMRELKYRGTLRGIPIEQNREIERCRLANCLIPEWIRGRKDEPTLLISPHKQLHQLPFHALGDQQGHLIERFGFLYTPSLEAWTLLARASRPKGRQMLVCGLDDFDGRLPALPFIRDEVSALQGLNKPAPTVWWGEDARRARLVLQNQLGNLHAFGILHFATHAIVDPQTPHWSRIVLEDQDLSIADILDLELSARLVTLSACSTALGKGGQGDEWTALARAFFYAGAQTVVATQWPIEDDLTTSTLMHDFYRQLQRGATISDALRAAQLGILRTGRAPYYWAGYSVTGRE